MACKLCGGDLGSPLVGFVQVRTPGGLVVYVCHPCVRTVLMHVIDMVLRGPA